MVKFKLNLFATSNSKKIPLLEETAHYLAYYPPIAINGKLSKTIKKNAYALNELVKNFYD